MGAAVGQRGHRRPARPGRSGRHRGPRERRVQPQAPGRRPGRGQAADPRARAADEGVRRRLRRGRAADHDLLHRPAPRRLPRAGPRPGRDDERQGRTAPALAARRGPAHRRHRQLRTRAVLRDVPRRLRTGQRPDGQGPGPAAQPAAHLGRVRAADVLPQVRAPALPGLRRAGAGARRRGRDRRTAWGRSWGTTSPARRSSSGWPPTDAAPPARWPASARRARRTTPARTWSEISRSALSATGSTVAAW